MDEPNRIRAQLIWPQDGGAVHVVDLLLPGGATVGDALALAGWDRLLSQPQHADLSVGVWSRRCESSQPLRDRDRIEIYAPLKVDPKVARRERFAKQGSRAAGLFAHKRPGAKAGY